MQVHPGDRIKQAGRQVEELSLAIHVSGCPDAGASG
jgi:hypothetical protein